MGQTPTKMQTPMISNSNHSDTETNEPTQHVYYCKLSSQNQPTLEYESKLHKVAHGTRFVYFKTDKSIILSQYTLLLCNAQNVSNTCITFELSKLRFHSEIVYMGESYFQFVCPVQNNNMCRLLIRTKKKSIDDSEQVIGYIDDPRVWSFVWEIHIQNQKV